MELPFDDDDDTPSFNPESDQSQEYTTAERLFVLTQEGQLHWEYIYPNQPQMEDASVESMASITQPLGYVVQDHQHGFGIVALKLQSADNDYTTASMIEETEPVLLMNGEPVDARQDNLRLLKQAIEWHMENLQKGDQPTMQEQMQQRVQAQVAPLRQEINVLEQELEESESDLMWYQNHASQLQLLLRQAMGDAPPISADTVWAVLVEDRARDDNVSRTEAADMIDHNYSDDNLEEIVDRITSVANKNTDQSRRQLMIQ